MSGFADLVTNVFTQKNLKNLINFKHAYTCAISVSILVSAKVVVQVSGIKSISKNWYWYNLVSEFR